MELLWISFYWYHKDRVWLKFNKLSFTNKNNLLLRIRLEYPYSHWALLINRVAPFHPVTVCWVIWFLTVVEGEYNTVAQVAIVIAYFQHRTSDTKSLEQGYRNIFVWKLQLVNTLQNVHINFSAVLVEIVGLYVQNLSIHSDSQVISMSYLCFDTIPL